LPETLRLFAIGVIFLLSYARRIKLIYLVNRKNGEIILNEYSEIVKKHWNEIKKYYSEVELLEYVVMPNPIHKIL